MADLQVNLTQYRAQLSQVEAALTTDPENEELLKLKNDLEEVINLTLDLLKVNEKGPPKELAPSTTWKVGDRCEAVWSKDGNYYPAVIDLISDDCTTCTVTFDYGNTEIVKLNSVRANNTQAAAGQKRSNPNDDDDDDASSGSNKKISRKEKDQLREQKRKKMAKKQQRLKELGEQREQEKNRWLDFFNNSKGGASSSKQPKNLKGVSKKSIFASPETLTGRVGVGTCGIGDKPMTNFPKQDKVVYKK
ncbi:survival of motor neuron-related-splicing factor 30-like [Actinia tenebrosa]|uniref:Survival of motor neuron-related-splicing factor 30 n=1 Tax=Actinia tenebrosa TaxID=6105 RepID=A0A6P8I3I0_ACTTE|nr:survival of motor neuron-related-splicing factor 30-like [Actinia tenebrosa]